MTPALALTSPRGNQLSLLAALALFCCTKTCHGFVLPSSMSTKKRFPLKTLPENKEDGDSNGGELDTDEDTSTSSSSSSVKSSLSSVASTVGSTGRTTQLTKTTAARNRWDSFDYSQQWYPVSWDVDLVTNQPTKVTVFDVDYVIARDSNGQYTALEDRCPHKAAALSEGRMTSSGLIQCAYHGWSFDGTTGDCVQIPQAPANSPPKRNCARAIPIKEHQDMIWLWPGRGPPTQDPPTIPEMDQEGFRIVKVVRDFPDVDWPLLLSNIMDPDHGCFAHTALAFDMYTADQEHPLQVEEFFDGPNWGFYSQVAAVDKVLKIDKEKRIAQGMKVKEEKNPVQKMGIDKEGEQPPEIKATSRLWAPTTVSLCRRDEKGETKFITAFWVTPVGTGRSRFMSAAVSKGTPFQIPRWIFQIGLNRFLDQDTLLVATQQPPLLKAEAEGIDKPRSSLFSYGSATDKTVRLIDQFWDSTLHKVPNRARTLFQLYNSGKLNQTPPREVVLDRYFQHLKICPDSQGFVRKCKIISKASWAVTVLWVVDALWHRNLPRFRWIPILGSLVAYAADQLRRQFYFCKTEASRNKDLKQIPHKAWLDP